MPEVTPAAMIADCLALLGAQKALCDAATPGPLRFAVFPKSKHGPGHLIIHAPDGPRWMQVAFVPRPPDILDATWQRICDTYKHFAAARSFDPAIIPVLIAQLELHARFETDNSMAPEFYATRSNMRQFTAKLHAALMGVK